MQIYFGAALPQDGFVGGDNFVFENILGEVTEYWYSVEYGSGPEGEDGITIMDTCDRYLPVDMENVHGLILALQEALAKHEELKACNLIVEEIARDDFTIAVS